MRIFSKITAVVWLKYTATCWEETSDGTCRMGWSRFEYEADSREFPGLQETELTVVAYKGKITTKMGMK